MFNPIVGNHLQIGATRVHFLQIGEGRRTVVLLHGFASLAQEIAAPFDALDDAKFIAIDRPGYGFSDPLPANGAKGPAEQAKWLSEVLDALGERDCVVVAHSMGSGAALWLSARRPDLVSRLILLAPFCRPTHKWGAHILNAAVQPGIGPLISNLLIPAVAPRVGPLFLKSALFPNPVPKHLDQFPFHHVGKAIAVQTMAYEYAGFQKDMAEFDRRQQLRAPISIIFGSDDRVARPDWHTEWLDALEPSIDVSVLQGVGHAPHHARPNVVRSAIQSAL